MLAGRYLVLSKPLASLSKIKFFEKFVINWMYLERILKTKHLRVLIGIIFPKVLKCLRFVPCLLIIDRSRFY